MPKLAEPQRPCRTRGAFDVSRVDTALKVIPTVGCHRRVRRELLLFEISGGQLTSSRTGWIPNSTDTTRDERLPRIEPGHDAQADGTLNHPEIRSTEWEWDTTVPRSACLPAPNSTISDFASSNPSVNRRQGRTIELCRRFCQGPLFVPDLLCTTADQAHRAFAFCGLSGVPAAGDGLWWTVRLVLDGGHCCLEGARDGQQGVWIADPQQPGDCVTRYYCPADAGARAADGDPVHRRETLCSKEIQLAQIKDQPAATQQMPQRVLDQSLSVGCVDAAVGTDDSYRRLEPTTGEPCRVTLPRLGKKAALRQHGGGGRSIHGDPRHAVVTGVFGAS